MDTDSLRQITDAIYYVAYTVKVAASCLLVGIGLSVAFLLIDTTRIETHLKKLKESK